MRPASASARCLLALLGVLGVSIGAPLLGSACTSFDADATAAQTDGASPPEEGSSADGGSDAAPLSAPVVAVSLQRSPIRIALDADAVYWRNAGEATDAGGPRAEIVKLARSPGAAPIQLARDIQGGDGLTIDKDYVFWGSGGPCGTPIPVQRIKKTGGLAPEQVVSGCTYRGVSDLVVDGPDVFFVYPGAVARARQGSAVTTMAMGTAQALAIDKLSVYFAQPSTATLVRIDKSDVTHAVNVFAPSQRVVAAVTDDTAVYWITENNTVARLDRDKPSTAPTVLASDQPAPTAIALTATHVLWTNGGDGTVRRVAKTGGTPETIASQQDDPAAIAADDAGIYWLNRRPGTVVRIGL
jgi:hypothetical protein